MWGLDASDVLFVVDFVRCFRVICEVNFSLLFQRVAVHDSVRRFC